MQNLSYHLAIMVFFLSSSLWAQEEISVDINNAKENKMAMVKLTKHGEKWLALGAIKQNSAGETEVRYTKEYKKELSTETVEEWLFLARELPAFQLVWGEPEKEVDNRLRLSITKGQERISWDLVNVIRDDSDDEKDQIAKWMLLLLEMAGMEDKGLLLAAEEM